MISNYLIFISNQFCFWRSRRWTSTFRRKIRNNSNEGRMYFLSLLCGTEISGNGIISNLKASLLYFHIRLEWESPCSDCLSFIHTWEELEHSYAVVCQSFFFSLLTEKLYCLPPWECLWKLVVFYIWNSFFERTCESNYWIGNRYFTPLQTQLEVLDTTADLQNSPTQLKTPKMIYPKKCWKLLELAL